MSKKKVREEIPTVWERELGIFVLDPNGWRGTNGRSWLDPITETEFRMRCMTSSITHLSTDDV